jgi:ABC-2 type transport system permease protein
MELTAGVSRSLALTRHELRIMRANAAWYASGFLMPLVVMAFAKPLFRYALTAGEGYRGANGAEQAVPGFAVMFGFFLMAMGVYAIFNEHGNRTWDRLRATPARPLEILAGELLPFFVLAILQQVTLFALGWLLLDLEISGSVVAIGVVAAALAASFVGMSALLVAFAPGVQQVNVIQTLGAMVFAGLGGALAPVSLLPSWLATLSPALPSYWAMRGYRAVILQGGGLSEVMLPAAVLLAFAAGFVVLALGRFRFEEPKAYWQ